MYSSVVMEHFTNPRNVGVIEDADGVGTGAVTLVDESHPGDPVAPHLPVNGQGLGLHAPDGA